MSVCIQDIAIDPAFDKVERRQTLTKQRIKDRYKLKRQTYLYIRTYNTAFKAARWCLQLFFNNLFLDIAAARKANDDDDLKLYEIRMYERERER